MLVQGLHNTRATASGVCLVGFGGALSDRRGSRPPYFSGRGVAAELKLPLVAISDPSLTLDETLPLAWCAGNSSERKLAHVIARVLDHIATCSGLRLIMFGGSGGGYATLAQASLLTSPFTALVWNPQTSIGEYAPEFVLHYLKVAFPELSEDACLGLALPKNQQKSVVYQLLPKTGVLHTLWDVPRVSGASVLYLQNRHDWYLTAHAKPYLGESGWRRLGTNSFGHTTELALHIGSWGAGHAAPPKELINDVLRQLVKGESVTSVASGLAVAASPEEYCQWLPPVALQAIRDVPLRINATFKAGQVTGHCLLTPGVLQGEVAYAFYLLVEGHKTQVRWYEASPTHTFTLEPTDLGKTVQVLGFVRETAAPHNKLSATS